MRQPHTDVQTQLPMPLPRPPRRMTQVPIGIAWLVLGTDVAVLLALLTVALAPALQALVRFPTSAELVSDQHLALREGESLGLAPFTLDDVFARP